MYQLTSYLFPNNQHQGNCLFTDNFRRSACYVADTPSHTLVGRNSGNSMPIDVSFDGKPQ